MTNRTAVGEAILQHTLSDNKTGIEKRRLTYKNVKYGMLVEVLHGDGGHHAGRKVHFFNRKGVLVGNYYEFMPYERLRLREPSERYGDRTYPRYFMDEKFEKIKRWLYLKLCALITRLIRVGEKYMD